MSIDTLHPSSDGTTVGTWTDVPSADASFLDIDDYVGGGTPDGETSYVQGPNKLDASHMFGLTDTSAGFTPSGVQSVVATINHRRVLAGQAAGADTLVGFIQIFKADGVTALTNEVAINGGATLPTAYTEYPVTLTQQGIPTKAEWDGALIRVRYDYTSVGTADTTVQPRITALKVEINWTPPNPQVSSATMGDSDRDWTNCRTKINVVATESIKRATAGGYSAGAVIPGLYMRITYASAGETHDYPVYYVSGDLSAGASSFVVDVPIILRNGDLIAIRYDPTVTNSELVAVDDGQEMLSSSVSVTNNLTKRLRKRLQLPSGSWAASLSVKWAIHSFGNFDIADSNFYVRTDKGTATTDADGWLDVQYTGSGLPGETVFGDFEYSSSPVIGFCWMVQID